MNKLLVILLCAFTTTLGVCDELRTFPAPGGFFASSDPTNVMHWETPNSNGTIIFMPGGYGQFNLKTPWSRNRVKGIARTAIDVGGMDSVFVDSPYNLPDAGFNGYPSTRATTDHLKRIESVVRYYKETTRKPVWLMGHSNGTFSVSQFVRYLQKNGDTGLIDGLVLSGSREVIEFTDTLQLPILFVHHIKDACRNTDYYDAQRTFNKTKEINKSVTKFVTITGGYPEDGHPCFSSHHMMSGAFSEVSSAITQFIKESK